jgi:hypothetical protein
MHNRLVFFRRSAMVQGKFVQPPFYRGLSRENAALKLGPVCLEDRRVIKLHPTLFHTNLPAAPTAYKNYFKINGEINSEEIANTA